MLQSFYVFVLFCSPMVLGAEMKVRLDVEFPKKDEDPKINIEVSGANKAIVTDPERFVFGLSDGRLKDCVKSVNGKRPKDAYVHSPTPWNDLYKSYNWPQTYRVIKPKGGRVVSINSEKIAASHKTFINVHDTEMKGMFSFTHSVSKTLQTTWSKGGEFSYGGEVGISVGVKSVGIDTSGHFEVKSSWGHEVSETLEKTVADTAQAEFTVKPHTAANAYGYFMTTKVTVEIDYETYLEGNTAVNYYPKYNDHHFHTLEINSVMRSCGLRTAIPSTEKITLDIISSARITVEEEPLINNNPNEGRLKADDKMAKSGFTLQKSAQSNDIVYL